MLNLEFRPLAADRWQDFEALFGPRGACGGCWCMYWRLSRSEFEANKGEGNRKMMRELLDADEAPGILAYADGQPIGWCALAPRQAYPTLGRSRVLKPVDNQAVWSITCFFVAKVFRRKGVTTQLLKAAVDHAARRGAYIVEGYPIEPTQDFVPPVFAYTGLASSFHQAGFVEVARRSETRPIMRYYIGAKTT